MADTDLADDLLVAYVLAVLPPEQAAAIARRLAQDPHGRRACERLQRELARLDDALAAAGAAAEPPDLADRVWARVAEEVRGGDGGGEIIPLSRRPAGPAPAGPRAGADGRRRTAGRRRDVDAPLAWGALAASVLLFVAGVAFEAGLQRGRQAAPAVVVEATPERERPAAPGQATTPRAWEGRARDRVLFAQVQRHLGASERLLVDVSNTRRLGSAAARMDAPALEAEQEWARTLLYANRIYRFAAERSGQARIAELLRDLEPLLIELSNGEPVASPRIAGGISEGIAGDDLLSRVRQARRDAAAGAMPARNEKEST